jgi:hypothetical protein
MNDAPPALRRLLSTLGPWTRRALIGACLLLLYALVGFLLLPAIARPRIEAFAGGWLGRRVTLDRLRINPFAISTSLEGLSITDHDGAPLVRWDRLSINFDPVLSILKREWVFKDVRLIGAAARLAMTENGTLNIDDITAKLSAAPEGGQPTGPPPVVRIRRLRIEDGSVSFVDRSMGGAFTSTLGPLRLDLSDFTTRSDEDSTYSFRGGTESGETFSWRGLIAVDPLRSEGEFALERIALTKYQPYYRGTVPFDIRNGTADLSSRYRFVWGPREHILRLVDASAVLHDLRLSEHGKEEIAAEAPVMELEGADLDLLTTSFSLRRFATRGGRILLRKATDGKINLLEMMLPFYAESPAEGAGAPSTAAPAAPAKAPPTVTIAELGFQDYTVDVEDLSQPRPVRVQLDQVNLKIHGADNVLGTTAKGILDLRWNQAGTIHVDGDVSLVGLNGDFAVKIEDLDVVPVEPYIEPALDLRVRSGAFSASGRTKANLINPEKPQFSFTGDVRLDNLTAVDGPRGKPFLRWRSVDMAGVDYSLQENRMRVADLTLASPELTLIQAPNGAINIYSVLRWPQAPAASGEGSSDAAGGTGDATGDAPPTGGGPAAEGVGTTESPAPATPPAPQPATPGTPAPAETGDTRIARARLRGGQIRVVDEGMNPPVSMALTHIEGRLAGLSSRPGARAEVHLAARLNDTAPVTLEGQVDPLGADVFTDLALLSQGIDLKPIGPYSARYLGYEFQRGRLDLDMRYRLEQRNLKGTNVFKADPFLLGEKTQSPDATRLPVRLGLALLRDRHGVIELDVPVEGNLDDPKFRLGRLIMRAIVNVFTKLVASPFTLLARAFAGKEDVDLSVIDFAPGDAGLSDESLANLESLAKGLVERPGLALLIQGGADKTADPDALRQARVDALIRKEKWRTLGRREREATPEEKVPITPDEYNKFLKRAFKTFQETHPRGKDEAPLETPEQMEAWMLERIEIVPGDLTALAAARAASVRDRLAASGVAGERLALRQDAVGDAARVTLELQ